MIGQPFPFSQLYGFQQPESEFKSFQRIRLKHMAEQIEKCAEMIDACNERWEARAVLTVELAKLTAEKNAIEEFLGEKS